VSGRPKILKEFPASEPIVSMIQFKGRILLATTQRVYEIIDDKVVPLVFHEAEPAA